MQYETFLRLVQRLIEQGGRFVVIGVSGANYYARTGAEVFTTEDRDLFLPPDPENLLKAWTATVEAGYQLWAGDEPLGKPLDLTLADVVVSRRALTTATHADGLTVDLTLVMAGFDFETVWKEHRRFHIDDVEIPVARLAHIVESKARANRPKDRLFLETYRERLRDLLGDEGT